MSGEYDEISWHQSYQYDEIVEKFQWIREFKGIKIHEFKLDEDTFFDNMPNEDFKQLTKEFTRDYKIKQLIK